MRRNIRMHNYLSKSLLDDNDLKIDECVILGSKSFHMKLQPEEGTIGLYVVSGCATVYEFDINLVIIDTSIVAPGQLLRLNAAKTKTILIESLGSFDEDVKFLKIERKLHAR